MQNKNKIGIIKRVIALIGCVCITAVSLVGCNNSTTNVIPKSSDDIDIEQARSIIAEDCLDLVTLCSDSTRFTFYVDRNTRVIWVKYISKSRGSFSPIPNADGSFKTFEGELPETGNSFSEEELIEYAKEIYDAKYK